MNAMSMTLELERLEAGFDRAMRSLDEEMGRWIGDDEPQHDFVDPLTDEQRDAFWGTP